MHVPSGEIHQLNEEQIKAFEDSVEQIPEKEVAHEKRLANRQEKMVGLTQSESEQLLPLSKKQRKGWMRNQPCVCGSGKKFKQCCWSKYE